MKKIVRYLLPLLMVFVSLFTACVKDEGTYRYLSDEEAGEIKFDTTGIPNRLIMALPMNAGDHIEFEPNVIYKYPEQLRYRWFVLRLTNYSYLPEQVGNAMVYPKGDTIAYSKKLDWVCDLKPGQYRFQLLAEDSITGMRGYYNCASYTVVNGTGTQNGLYLLSEVEGGSTDIEVMTSSLMLICGGDATYPRYYSRLAGSTLPGKPRFIKGTHTGSLAKNGYMVCTDNNLYRINQVNMTIMDEWKDMFYNLPATFNPQRTYYANNCDFLVNDGKLHTLYTNVANDRKFSDPVAGDYEAGDYLMFETRTTWYPTPGAINSDQVIYDKKNHMFRPYYARNSAISNFKATTGEVTVDANKLPVTPKVILNGSSNQTYCIVEENGTPYLYRFNFYNRVDEGNLEAEGSRSKINLSGCQEIGAAKLYATCTKGPAFYYATDHAVYSFTPSSGTDKSNVVYECGPNETVTSIYACGSVGGGWPTSYAILWVALWDSTRQEGKLVEFEVNHAYGVPEAVYGPMFGVNENPTVTTGWGKIVDMTFISAE